MTSEQSPYAVMLLSKDLKRHNGREKAIPASEVIFSALRDRLWPIYQNTRHKEFLSIGQRVLFYAAGQRELSQCILASAVVASIESNAPSSDFDDMFDAPRYSFILKLQDVQLLEKPFNLKQHRSEISFVRNAGFFWYTSLQGGCVLVSKADWDLIHG